MVRRNNLTFFAHWAYAFKAKNSNNRRNNIWKHTLLKRKVHLIACGGKDKDLVKRWKNSLDHTDTFKFDNSEFDPVRLRRLFELYYEKKAEKDNRRTEKYEAFSVEYALSQIFSPKQKELFKKKLDGLPLTKIEKEYYSRTVKKKVVALANSKLHRLSQKLLGI